MLHGVVGDDGDCASCRESSAEKSTVCCAIVNNIGMGRWKPIFSVQPVVSSSSHVAISLPYGVIAEQTSLRALYNDMRETTSVGSVPAAALMQNSTIADCDAKVFLPSAAIVAASFTYITATSA